MLDRFDEKPDSTLTIIDNKPLGHPKCLDNNKIIFLSTAGNTFWSQNAYQLSHEFCHYFIQKKTSLRNNSWFEESLCELSSIYFLSILSSEWEKSQIFKKVQYSGPLNDYHSELLSDVSPFDLSLLNDKESQLYEEMNKDPYLRDNNKYISIKMLPIFIEFPTLWQDVHLIRQCNIKNLRSFFSEWIRLASNKNASGILKISKLFL